MVFRCLQFVLSSVLLHQSPEIEDLPVLDSTVFEDITDLFESIMNDMLKNIVNYVFTDVQARSQPYRKDK